MEEIRITAPTSRTCRVCAVEHEPSEPHDRDSLYYQVRFWQKNKRFPTWDDAMSHCTEEVKACFRVELVRRGVLMENTVQHER